VLAQATEQDVVAEIKRFIVDLHPDFDREITLSSSFEAIGLDSLSQVDLLGAIEQIFEIQVPDSEISKIAKVKDLVGLIVGLSSQV